MNPIVWLAAAVVLVALVAIAGVGPKGGKPVARTRLMKTARGFLIVGILICAALGIFGSLRP